MVNSSRFRVVMAIALFLLMVGTSAALAATASDSADATDPCPTLTETASPEASTDVSDATDAPAVDDPSIEPSVEPSTEPSDDPTCDESPEPSETETETETPEPSETESGEDGSDSPSSVDAAACAEAAGIDPNAEPTDAPEHVTGLDNAIQHVYANCVAHPNEGLVNALEHLVANRDAKAARDQAKAEAAAARAQAKADRKAAHDAAEHGGGGGHGHGWETHGHSGSHGNSGSHGHSGD